MGRSAARLRAQRRNLLRGTGPGAGRGRLQRQIARVFLVHGPTVSAATIYGAASDVVGIWRGAISGHLKVSFQAARSIG